MELALVQMEWVNVARLRWSMWSVAGGFLCGMSTFPLIWIWSPVALIGNVHKLVRLQMSIVMKRVPFVEMTLLKSILATSISTVGVATLPG